MLSMKIFLTEMTKDGEVFPGPNIIAQDSKQAKEVADYNGLILLGEFKEIFFKNELMSYIDEDITNRVLH